MTAEAPPAAMPDARERLLEAAEALVYAGGIHATGVDAIVRAAGAARKSFYTWFESKDALVAAALMHATSAGCAGSSRPRRNVDGRRARA